MVESQHRRAGRLLFIAALIPLGDLFNVYANVRTRNVAALTIHGGTALFMCVLGAVLLER
jgi:hypothetical protein